MCGVGFVKHIVTDHLDTTCSIKQGRHAQDRVHILFRFDKNWVTIAVRNAGVDWDPLPRQWHRGSCEDKATSKHIKTHQENSRKPGEKSKTGVLCVTWHAVAEVGEDSLGSTGEDIGRRVDERVPTMAYLLDAPEPAHLDRKSGDPI